MDPGKHVGGAWKWALCGAGVGVLMMCLTLASAWLDQNDSSLLGILAEYHPLLLPATQLFTLVFQRDIYGLSGVFDILFPVFLIAVNTAIYAGAGYGLWWARPRGRRSYLLVAGVLIALSGGSLGAAALLGYGSIHADGIGVRMAGMDFHRENWEGIRVGQTGGKEVVALLGEPACRLREAGREFLIYRTLSQAKSWDMFFSIALRTYYYTPEHLYFVALRNGVVEERASVETAHLIPAEDVEFKCEIPQSMRLSDGPRVHNSVIEASSDK